MLVQFGIRKLIGDAVPLLEMDARLAEAMAVLEGEVRKEGASES